MKICWDMLEGVYLTKNGTFRKNSVSYIFKGSCAKCGEPYLTVRSRQSNFCSTSCAGKDVKASEATKKLLSKLQRGSNNSSYKGGIFMAGLTTYDTYKDKLDPYEDIRKQNDTGILEVKCAYCGRWYMPTHIEVRGRLRSINVLNHGEGRLYCSENCKQACPTYYKKIYPKGFKHTTSREVSTYLRQMVLERDNWTCQICGKTIKEAQLHVHHTDPVRQHPMFQNDMDSCITLCKGCHKMVHSVKGCRYVDLQCKKVEPYEEEANELRGMRKKKISEEGKL